MATSANLSSIIRHYAEKSNSPFIDLRDFCTYIKKYAEHHVEEKAELVKYLADTTNTVNAELQGLSEKHLVALITVNNKKTIVSISSFSVNYANRFKEIMKNETIPYPVIADLPKNFPLNVLEKKSLNQHIKDLTETEDPKSPLLYIIDCPKDVPSMVLPACVPLKVLLDTAQKKVRRILKKEEFHDYFLKKIRSTNPTKEISIRNFYTQFVDTENYQFVDFSDGDDYYIWNQTLYYIRQDFEKIQDRTQEDTSILQAVSILEVHSTYLKEKFQEARKRSEALKELEHSLAQPPFFYSMNQILKFQDKNGRLLYGQYSEEDLKEFLQRMTTESDTTQLPILFVFKISSGRRYYVYKQKVIQVVVRLCNEAHNSVERQLEDKWYNALLGFEKLPEMTNKDMFEKALADLIEINSPILHALLNANFMTLLSYEKDTDDFDSFNLFIDGHLLPYSTLLMLKSSNILANAKSRLPFFYTIPVISWFISLFASKKKTDSQTSKQVQQDVQEDDEKQKTTAKHLTKTQALAAQAKSIVDNFVPEGSTMDRELDYLIKQWNTMISKEAYNNLTEDVNALIRDYTRRVVKTLSATSFTKERVENLAKTLVNTPNMQKIKDSKSLTDYVILYMIRLVSNFN